MRLSVLRLVNRVKPVVDFAIESRRYIRRMLISSAKAEPWSEFCDVFQPPK